MKLVEIINSEASLKKLLSTDLPVKVAFKIAKLVNKINPDLKIYEEQRFKIIKELGEQTDKEKDIWSVKPENFEKFKEELTKLSEIEVDLSFAPGKPLEKIKIEDLGDIKLEPNDLVPLEWLIE